MRGDFEFRVRWLERLHGSMAEREAFGELEIRWDDLILTELEDLSAATVRPATRVSVLSLGTWLAANWWRLRWEPMPATLDANWRLAHELGGAGGGFVWPSLRFAADGESVGFSLTDGPSSGPPVRYLRRAEGAMPAAIFERAVDELMSLLLGRLSARRVQHVELMDAWREVEAERRDGAIAAVRRREALLGFDPDELGAEALSEIVSQGLWMGESALEETMALARGSEVRSAIDGVRDLSTQPGSEIDLAPLGDVRHAWAAQRSRAGEPWQRGAALAALTREGLGLSTQEPVSAECIAGIMGHDMASGQPARGRFSAGFRTPGAADRVTFQGIRRHPNSRRFEAARLLADALDGPSEDLVLPITDASTARQKVQRSFAQEFLCPAEALAQHVRLPNPADSEIENVAHLFGVSEFTVRSALVNRGLVERHYLPNCWTR